MGKLSREKRERREQEDRAQKGAVLRTPSLVPVSQLVPQSSVATAGTNSHRHDDSFSRAVRSLVAVVNDHHDSIVDSSLFSVDWSKQITDSRPDRRLIRSGLRR